MQSNRKQEIYAHFEQNAGDYLQYRKRFSYYGKDIINYLNFFISESDTVLEIGCGNGDTIHHLKGKEKTGIDFSPKMIEVAKANFSDVDFLVMDAENIKLEKKFDVIIFNNIIGYLENVQDVFYAIKKNCHEHTRVIISYYNHYWQPLLNLGETIGYKKKSPQQNWLDTKDISNLLYLSGFETYRTNKRLLLPIYLPILSWLINKYIAKLPLFKSMCLNQFTFARPQLNYSEKDVAQKYSVSICIPARNESGNIENAILRLPKFGKHQEIIFIEGNSSDDTWQKIQDIQQKYKDTHDIKIGQQSGKGKGDAVRKGYAMANGDILMILDADLTMPPEELPKFYNAIATGKGEFINGSRLVYPMEKEAMRFLNTLGNKFFSWVFSWLLEQPIKDSLCGTKVMFREDYLKLIENRKFFGDFDPFGDFDLLFGAYKLNLKIIDLPIRYRERTYGDTNISRFTNGFMLLRMCWFAAGKIKFW
ncbi:MAG TPA: bifunctional class I SAM-dependent methyltransferase/glycosyltransferase family 2 protein [Chitinophagales bacterium]|jgi:SAM-dependent methyltransferase|nr:glycosyltransferase [Chitinophagales bacterium]MBP6153888.1 glycosyltransferase [Chitinophagales bacterium]HQV79204.1 bifunctional class I SAM-dependent methyltransferase/glycosyltransferase family 2 protein [Chitinophagales bacterium]HQW80004.1 bifunctional class I SAM-dependent methyltransferase/glycosyltransferase family 2 protein [Chitinophagales bacterium]HRB67891.1 bifunctional class I SAM-dependent methyltransferase/glycosyltransferase family 2 protein [Chitinophagales bacterium]